MNLIQNGSRLQDLNLRLIYTCTHTWKPETKKIQTYFENYKNVNKNLMKTSGKKNKYKTLCLQF